MTDTWPDYELLDFGDGRKLERFGAWVLDRPCPAAEKKKKHPALWGDAMARFEGDRAADGVWTPKVKNWESAEIDFPVRLSEQDRFQLQLAPLPSGQIGLFFEQFANWQWIARHVHWIIDKYRGPNVVSVHTFRIGGSSAVDDEEGPPRVLNLFAYTGGSSLAAASAGAEVTHVDAAKSMVARARENARVSGLENATIRWIVEDAVKFCQREVKRGNQYDAVILDPPSYGHGPKGEEWSIKRDLLPLLELCGELTAKRRAFVLCTCHSPSIGPAELSAYFADGLFGHCGQQPNSGNLYLQTADGRKLPSGVFARWPA
jgi:23S rRNA (cytosine1962-C5)-methyltransferase